MTETWGLIQLAAEKKAVFQSVLGVSWFWLIGSIYLAQIANMTRLHLAGGAGVVTLILAFFTISIAVGSLLCEKLSGRRVEIGLVPLGAAGISVFGIDTFWAIGQIEGEGLRTAAEFLRGEGTPRLLVDLGLMGLFAGMFVVPLQANIQSRTPDDRRARVIAANNVLNALFIVAGSGLAILWLVYLDRSIPSLFLLVAIANAFVAAYIFRQVPEFAMRFLVWLLSHTLYRVRHEGLEYIPERGPAVLVCNHVSYVDAMLLAGAIQAADPLRDGQEHLRPARAQLRVSHQPDHPHHVPAGGPASLRSRLRADPHGTRVTPPAVHFSRGAPDVRRRDRRFPQGHRADRRKKHRYLSCRWRCAASGAASSAATAGGRFTARGHGSGAASTSSPPNRCRRSRLAPTTCAKRYWYCGAMGGERLQSRRRGRRTRLYLVTRAFYYWESRLDGGAVQHGGVAE